MERILFLLPVAYAGYIFGLAMGLGTLSVAVVIMLPRAIFSSPIPRDSLFEIAAVGLVAGLVLLWFEGQQREKEQRQQALTQCEVAQYDLYEALAQSELARQEVSGHLQIIKDKESRR